jgi:transposase
MPRPKGSAEVIEARRRQALRLLDQGYSLGEVGRMTGCAASSVMRWRDARTRGGKQALKVRPTPGRPSELNDRDRRRIVQRLLKGAMANGFATELWTTTRVAQVIHKCCGIQYHRSHVARLLHELGFSCQKPERRALERDEARIEQWKRRDWPRVKKTLRGWVPISPLSTNPASC